MHIGRKCKLRRGPPTAGLARFLASEAGRKSPNAVLGFEMLEARLPMAANFVISEFMAENSGSLLDNYNVASDWIEISNQGDLAGSLNGYYLTDDAGDETKWQFPDVTVPAGGHLLVFASG